LPALLVLPNHCCDMARSIVVKVGFMAGFDTPLAGIAGCRLTRCGYTGEDGFELSVPNDKVLVHTLRSLSLSQSLTLSASMGRRSLVMRE
jgi:glycine cleavage system aminomethyltransferase T